MTVSNHLIDYEKHQKQGMQTMAYRIPKDKLPGFIKLFKNEGPASPRAYKVLAMTEGPGFFGKPRAFKVMIMTEGPQKPLKFDPRWLLC